MGLWLVLMPLSVAVFQAGVAATRYDPVHFLSLGAGLLMLIAMMVVAGMDASSRGKTASILILLCWVIGYPLHMRERARHSSAYFGLGSALLVMAAWLGLMLLAGMVHDAVPIGHPVRALR